MLIYLMLYLADIEMSCLGTLMEKKNHKGDLIFFNILIETMSQQ